MCHNYPEFNSSSPIWGRVRKAKSTFVYSILLECNLLHEYMDVAFVSVLNPRLLLLLQGGIVSFAVLAGVVAIAVVLLTSTMNAAIASFFMSISMVGVFMAFFFSSVAVIYMGALGFGGLTISSIAFLSVCAVIFFSGELSGVVVASYELCFWWFMGHLQNELLLSIFQRIRFLVVVVCIRNACFCWFLVSASLHLSYPQT